MVSVNVVGCPLCNFGCCCFCCCCCYAAFVFVLIVVVVGCVSFAASSQRVLAGTDVAASIWGTTVVVAPIDEQLRLTKTNFTSNRSPLKFFCFQSLGGCPALLPHYIHFENPGFISSEV